MSLPSSDLELLMNQPPRPLFCRFKWELGGPSTEMLELSELSFLCVEMLTNIFIGKVEISR